MHKIKYLLLPLAFLSLSFGEINNLDEVFDNPYPSASSNETSDDESEASTVLRPQTRGAQAQTICGIDPDVLAAYSEHPECVSGAFIPAYTATGNCEKALCAYARCMDGDSYSLGEQKCNPVPVSSSFPLLFFALLYAGFRALRKKLKHR